MTPSVSDIPTPHGPARLHLQAADTPAGLLMLGHGAGGGITAADIQLAATVAAAAGWAVALVEQPYRVAGRKAPAPAAQVDAAWIAVAEHLAGRGEFADVPLVTGGRSFGARVACRTAANTHSAGVLCLAFPVHPPGRPEKSRQAELSAVKVPTLVIQGDRDPFGQPIGSATCQVVSVSGDHSLKKDAAVIRAAIAQWLPQFITSGE